MSDAEVPKRTGCPPEGTLAELVRRAYGGDTDAQVRLFEGCIRPQVRAVVLDLLLRWRGARRNVPEECEDLVQDVLEHLLSSGALRRWDPALGTLPAYVGKIAANKTLKTMCTRKRNPWASTPTEDLSIEALMPGHDGGQERMTLSRQVIRRIADEAGEDGMRLLFLFYVEGLTAREVGEVLDRSEASVEKARQRLCKGARNLLEGMSEGGAPPGRKG